MDSDDVKYVISGSFTDIVNILKIESEKNDYPQIRTIIISLKSVVDVLGPLSEKKQAWLTLINNRVALLPLNSDATKMKIGGNIDDLAAMHYEEYKIGESRVPKNKIKEVAINRIDGFISIKDYINVHYSKEHKFHFDASLQGALLYASSLGVDIKKYK